jgi:hypothetical protein
MRFSRTRLTNKLLLPHLRRMRAAATLEASGSSTRHRPCPASVAARASRCRRPQPRNARRAGRRGFGAALTCPMRSEALPPAHSEIVGADAEMPLRPPMQVCRSDLRSVGRELGDCLRAIPNVVANLRAAGVWLGVSEHEPGRRGFRRRGSDRQSHPHRPWDTGRGEPGEPRSDGPPLDRPWERPADPDHGRTD